MVLLVLPSFKSIIGIRWYCCCRREKKGEVVVLFFYVCLWLSSILPLYKGLWRAHRPSEALALILRRHGGNAGLAASACCCSDGIVSNVMATTPNNAAAATMAIIPNDLILLLFMLSSSPRNGRIVFLKRFPQVYRLGTLWLLLVVAVGG
jgi:hypothetical protein